MHLRSASASWDYAKQKDTDSGRAIWSRGDLVLLSWRKPPTVFPTPQYADRAPANRRTTIGANSNCHESQAALPGTCPAGIGGDSVSLHQANHFILDQYGLVQAEGQAGEWAQAIMRIITFLPPLVSMT